jgi:hypothetical protein
MRFCLPRGSQPGERRGGRQKERLIVEPRFCAQKVTDDPEQRKDWERCRLGAATGLSKYQSPTFEWVALAWMFLAHFVWTAI